MIKIQKSKSQKNWLFKSCSKTEIKKQDGSFVVMATRDLQTLNLKFDQVMFNSLSFACERNFEMTFSIFFSLSNPNKRT